MSHASKGPATAPIAFWWYSILSASSRSRTTSAPPTTSEWPPQYLVVECTTTSAPSASGCWRYGDAKVLSTTSRAPASCATAASVSMSPMLSSGLVGVSIQTILRLRGDRRADGVDVADGRRAVLEPPAVEHLVEEAVRPAVRVVGDHHVVTGVAERPQQRVLRGEAGGEREPALPLLQCRDVALEGSAGGVARSGCTRSRRAARRRRPACTSRSRRSAGSPTRSSRPARSRRGWPGSRNRPCLGVPGSHLEATRR